MMISVNKRIALLLPYYEGRNHSQFLGVGYLSQVLREAGTDTFIIDEDAVFSVMAKRGLRDPLGSARIFIIEKLRDYSPLAICVSVNTANYERSLELLRLIRERIPNINIIVGGPHITTSWFSFKKNHKQLFDIAVIGEGENTILEVCDRISSHNSLEGIKGTVLSQSNDSHFKPRELIKNLDSLPYPDREGFYKVFEKNEHAILDEHYNNVFYAHLPGFKGKKFSRIVGWLC